MERLTKVDDQGRLLAYSISDTGLPAIIMKGNPYRELIERLKAYEDTGLEPEGILDSKLRANWIPVTERLPEIGEPVLVTLWDKDVTAGTWYGHRWGTTLCYNEGVLAWMSLPKPFSQQN